MDLFKLSELTFRAVIVSYLMATVLYLILLVRKSNLVGKLATAAAVIAVGLQTIGLSLRRIEGGITHPPFTNMYESLIFFGWGIAVFYLVIEFKYQFRAGGAFILPIALGAMGAAALNPASSKEIHDLLPALQSYWLHAHVAIASIAYAAFVGGFGASVMFLIKDGAPRKWLGFSVNLFLAFMLLISDRFNILTHRVFTLNMVTPEGEVTGQFKTFASPGVILLLAAIYFVIAAVFYLYRGEEEGRALPANRSILGVPFAPFITGLGAVFTAIGLGLLGRATHTDPSVALFGNPFKIIILSLVIFVGAVTVFLDLKLTWVREALPAAERLDSISHVVITVAFPLMTMVIVTGMVWAKFAFGEYWQWDPKETASLITWLIYTFYLHARLQMNWSPRRVAAISIVGFASVVFTYLGVNVIGPGYHAYASF